jgi:hypothetical protein
MAGLTPRRLGLNLIGLTSLACAPPGHSATTDQERPPPRAELRRSAPFADDRVKESSGVAVSRDHPGVLWTHNDSGDRAWLYLTDTLGQALGRLLLDGAANRDWEDIALGPCPTGACLYLGDTGDNLGRRDEVVIYRVREPVPPRGDEASIRAVESIRFSYPDGPHDVEALFVDPVGDVHLISKGTSGPIHHYRLWASAWASQRLEIAEDMGVLPIRPDRSSGRLVTGAALAPDGQAVAIRTYREIYLGNLRADGSLDIPRTPTCDIAGFDPLGEAIDWLGDTSGTLVLTSETVLRGRGTVSLVRCPGGAAP